ncbi:MAG: LEA type 2 family protein [Sedimentisphaerales bacterium]|nr:LEA type 2 family protein [Sedimentisphaerales bacterium]
MARTKHPLVVSLAALSLLAGCASMQEALNRKRPTARLVDVRFDNIKLESATLLFDVEIANHYPVALPLLNFDYGLSSRAEQVLSGHADVQSTVPADGKKTVSLPATINYVQMLGALGGVRPGATIPYRAELALSVDAPGWGAIRLPLEKEGELLLPTLSDVKAGDILDLLKPR